MILSASLDIRHKREEIRSFEVSSGSDLECTIYLATRPVKSGRYIPGADILSTKVILVDSKVYPVHV